MKNQIMTAKDKSTGKYAVALYSYEEIPSGAIRPILRVSSQFVFASSEQAAKHLFENLNPEIQANTEMPNEIIPIDTPHDGKCESLWRHDLPCPNQAEFILRNPSNKSFAIMCGPHAEEFLQKYRGNLDVIAYTDAWVLNCETEFKEGQSAAGS